MMRNFPPFSVLMTLYHRENPDFFEAAVHSVLDKQSLKPSELVLVKDGQLTPELESRIAQLCDQYPQLHVFGLPENIGQGRASSFGLEKCQHDWVARMDSDDLSLPDRFEKQFAYLREHPDLAALGGQIKEFHHQVGDGDFCRFVPTSPEELARYMRFRNPINNMTVVYRKSLVEKIGFASTNRFGEDYDLWVSLLLAGYKLANLEDILVYARVGENIALKRSGAHIFQGNSVVFKKMYDAGFINRFQYLRNLAGTLLVAYLPLGLKSWLYQIVFRRKN